MHDGCYINHFPFDNIDDAIGKPLKEIAPESPFQDATRWDVAESVRRLIQPSPRTLVPAPLGNLHRTMQLGGFPASRRARRGLSMTKFLAYLTQYLPRRNGLCRLSLPGAKTFLGFCNPRFFYRCQTRVLHPNKQSLGQSLALRRRQLLRLFFESQRSCSHRIPFGRRTYRLGRELYKV